MHTLSEEYPRPTPCTLAPSAKPEGEGRGQKTFVYLKSTSNVGPLSDLHATTCDVLMCCRQVVPNAPWRPPRAKDDRNRLEAGQTQPTCRDSLQEQGDGRESCKPVDGAGESGRGPLQKRLARNELSPPLGGGVATPFKRMAAHDGRAGA